MVSPSSHLMCGSGSEQDAYEYFENWKFRHVGEGSSSVGHATSLAAPVPPTATSSVPSKKALYGPCIKIENHRRRNPSVYVVYGNTSNRNVPTGVIIGSHFTSLRMDYNINMDLSGDNNTGQKLSAATVEKKNVIKNVAYLQSNLGKKSITLKKSNDSLATIEQLKLLNKSAGVKTRVQPTVLEWVQNFSHELNLRGAVGNGSGDGVNASKVLASRISPLEAGHGLDHFQQSKSVTVQETLDFAVSSVKLFRNINQRWFPSLSREVQETLDFAVSSVKLFRNINQRWFPSLSREPTLHGGLGTRKIHAHNDSFLIKIAFRVLTQPYTLLARFLKSKYKCSSRLPEMIKNRNCSSCGKALALSIKTFGNILYGTLGMVVVWIYEFSRLDLCPNMPSLSR
ncbi:hypothetical protein V6N13_103669 [Hibiscus sabdariffa]